MSLVLSNVPAERAILAGLCQYNGDAYFEISDIINPNTFSDDTNSSIYRCIQTIMNRDDKAQLDIPLISGAAEELGLAHIINKKDELKYVNSLFQFPINLSNVRKFAAKIRRLDISKGLCQRLSNAESLIMDTVTGDEPMQEIISMAEEPIFDFISSVDDTNARPKKLGEGVREYIEYLMNNPVEQMGISTGYPAYDQAIGGGLRPGTVNVIAARPKALRDSSVVYMSSGPQRIDTLIVGDKICHPFCGYTTIKEIHVHPNTQIYKVSFKDGDTVDCCEDHLWEVYKRYPYDILDNKIPIIKTTKELINDLKIGKGEQYKWDIRLPKSIEFMEHDVPIDPYVLGLLIGDGSFRNAISFTTGDDELIQHIKMVLPNDIKLEQVSTGCKTYRINSLQGLVRETGLYKVKGPNKFVPKVYIYNSIETRIEMLRGLMDSDGDCTIDKKSGGSRTRFASVSYQLVLDVKEIVQSLGGLCSITEQHGTYKDMPHLSYRCEIRLPANINPFRLKRKANRHNNRKIGQLKRTICAIDKIDIDNARCLTLEHQDGLFLTDNFVITHNCGKTMLSDNMGRYISKTSDIPVLNMDTEMRKEDHQHRTLALMTGVPINDIETGKAGSKPDWRKKVLDGCDELEKIPYYYRNISGKPFEEQIGIMRRWLMQEVGLNSDGTAKPCVILYDYLKLMTAEGLSSDMKEYQLLGLYMTTLHNFAHKYDIPIVVMMQQNREGEKSNSTSTASGSDRIIWLCSNFSVFTFKTDDEIAQDGVDAGNRKLVPVVARHGGAADFGDYISYTMTGWCARIEEGLTKFELDARKKAKDEGFETDDSGSTQVEFNDQ